MSENTGSVPTIPIDNSLKNTFQNRIGFSKELFENEKLSSHSLLRDLSFEQVVELLKDLPASTLTEGDILITPGKENHHLYLLISGGLNVLLENTESQMTFPIEPGECIGEMSIIENRATSAWVIAREESLLVVMSEECFWEKYITLPRAIRNLLQMLVKRMRTNNSIITETVEKNLRFEHLQKELEAAGKIQANILPQKTALCPSFHQVDLFGLMEPAKQVGGDFYDAIPIDAECVAIVIGDVSGKGMPAALFMVRAMTLLRLNLTEQRDFETILPSVNRALCEGNDETMFVTLFVGAFNVKTGVLKFVNGGHNPPFIQRNGGGFEMLEVLPGVLLGVMEEAEYPVATLTMQPGDSIMLYTDGITEAGDPKIGLFEEERALEVLNANRDQDMETLTEALKEAVYEFEAGRPQADDITLLGLRYLGENGSG